MRYSGRTLLSFGLMVISGWMVFKAMGWPLRTGIFTIVVGIPVFCMATVEVFLSLLGNQEESEYQGLSARRAFLAFLWIIGFFLLIFFFGFSIAVPLFVFLHLRWHGKERWAIALALTGATWVFFYGLFVWLLSTPFPEGWVQKALRSFGIG